MGGVGQGGPHRVGKRRGGWGGDGRVGVKGLTGRKGYHRRKNKMGGRIPIKAKVGSFLLLFFRGRRQKIPTKEKKSTVKKKQQHRLNNERKNNMGDRIQIKAEGFLFKFKEEGDRRYPREKLNSF